MSQVDLSTIPLNSIERIEITRGNSGAVLYGDNAVGGVINIVTKTGVGGPPVAIRAEAGVGSFNQTAGQRLGRDQLRTVVDLVLRQRHQVGRLPRQQPARPAQRRRQPQLHHAGPEGLPHRDRRRPKTRLPGRTPGRSARSDSNELVTNRRGTDTPFDYGNQQGKSATAGFTKTIIEGVDLIVDGGVREQEEPGRIFRHRPAAELCLDLCRRRSDRPGRSRRA